MENRTIITIGREFGSGGRIIAEKLAKKLNVKCYDRELIYNAAKESGISPEVFENVDERATNSLLYSLSMGVYNFGINGYAQVNSLPVNDQLYILQHNIIKDLSDTPCVIVGRCADFILQDLTNVASVFISADFDFRVNRAIETKVIPKEKSETIVRKTDKKRANYYNFYTNNKWGLAATYDLCINRTKFTDDQIVDMIIKYVEVKEQTY